MSRAPASLVALIAAVAASSLMLFACGDDDGGGEEAGGPDVERYCALSVELDEAGSEAFRELESDPEATKADFEAAEREFVESNEEKIDEVSEVAPEEISEDVTTLFASLRARAGLGPEVDEAEVRAAEKRVQAFDKENCES